MARLTLTLLGGFQVRLGAGPPADPADEEGSGLPRLSRAPTGTGAPARQAGRLAVGGSGAGARPEQPAAGALRAPAGRGPVRPACLRVEGATIALNPDAVDVDAMTFERLVSERTPEALAQAVELYRGDLLDGLTLQEPPFEEWLMAERERLARAGPGGARRVTRRAARRRRGGRRPADRAAADRARPAPGAGAPHAHASLRPARPTGLRPPPVPALRGSPPARAWGRAGGGDQTLYQEILRRRPSVTATSEPVTSGGSRPFATIRRPPLILATDTPLIGRDQEMARLRAALAEAVSGQGRVMAFVGEAGVGKTRLVAELAAEAPAESGRVLIGRCHESEQILPFGPWVDALAPGRVREDRDMVRDPAAGYAARAGTSSSRTRARRWRVGGSSRLPAAFRGGELAPRARRRPAADGPDPRRPPLGGRDEHQAAGVHQPPPPGVAPPCHGDGARGGAGRCADASPDARRAGARVRRDPGGARTTVPERHVPPRGGSLASGQ